MGFCFKKRCVSLVSCCDLAGLMCHTAAWWIADCMGEKNLDKSIFIFLANVFPSLKIYSFSSLIWFSVFPKTLPKCPQNTSDDHWPEDSRRKSIKQSEWAEEWIWTVSAKTQHASSTSHPSARVLTSGANLQCPQVQTASFSGSCSNICEQNDRQDLKKTLRIFKG